MSDSEPFRLPEIYNPELKKEEDKAPAVYHVFEGYVKQLNKLGIPVTMEMQDYELTNFMNTIDQSYPIDRKITVMVRIKDVDWLGDKKRKEFLYWYETWTGVHSEGKIAGTNEERLVSSTLGDYPRGIDKRTLPRPLEYDKSGKALPSKPGETRWVYTELFSPEKIDEKMEGTVDTGPDTIQFLVKGSRPWGGFTKDEFQNLTFEELEDRGKKGTAGSPVIKKVEVKQTSGRRQEP